MDKEAWLSAGRQTCPGIDNIMYQGGVGLGGAPVAETGFKVHHKR